MLQVSKTIKHKDDQPMLAIFYKGKHLAIHIQEHKNLSNACGIHTFIDGRIPASVATTVSDFANKLFKSSSLVSAPVFFIFGEPTERDVPSLKEDAVLILSAYVENLRGRAKDGESRLTCPEMPFVARDRDTELDDRLSGNPNEIS